MATNTVMIHTRVPANLKEDAEKILAKLGITMSEAVRSLLAQIKIHKGLPYENRIPNRKTRQAIKDFKEGKNFITYNSVDEMFKKYE